MSSLFRPVVVRYVMPNGTRVPKDTPGSTKVREKSKKWHGQYTDAEGIRRRVPLNENKEAARQRLSELVRQVEMEKAGVRDPFREHRRRPLTEHLDDWRASLAANGRDGDYIAQKTNRVQAALDACRFVFPDDLSADRLELFLARLRREHGRSIQTSNDHLQAVKQFARWLVENDRLDRTPFARLKGGNVKLDRRHVRRDLDPDELQRLLTATRDSPRAFRGLGGADRYFLYLTACGTGFRAKELAALTPASFDLTAAQPVAVLPASATKNRKPATQPVPSDVAAALVGYLAGRDPAAPVWPGSWVDRSADMMKADLAEADVAAVVEGPEGTRKVDFHALRHTFISSLARAGVHPSEAKELARHSDVRLTMNVYTHARLHDLGAAVDTLPPIVPTASEGQSARATGTDGAILGCTMVALPPDSVCDSMRAIETEGGSSGRGRAGPQVVGVIGGERDCERLIVNEAERAGFEPAVQFDPYAALAKRGASDATSQVETGSGDSQSVVAPGLYCPQNAAELSLIVEVCPLPDAIKRAVLALLATVQED